AIEIEVKANIDYEMEIAESAKDWITEAKTRALTTYKHALTIATNEEVEKREGEIYFKSGDKVETVKIYQEGAEAIIVLSQKEYIVSDTGETISVDIRSNIEYSVQMPDVDWITDEPNTRGMSSHTLRYTI
ncbi:BACON domain-containing protein, partial [Bacteroides acidifaciens]